VLVMLVLLLLLLLLVPHSLIEWLVLVWTCPTGSKLMIELDIE
jgi:hypothetical protein